MRFGILSSPSFLLIWWALLYRCSCGSSTASRRCLLARVLGAVLHLCIPYWSSPADFNSPSFWRKRGIWFWACWAPPGCSLRLLQRIFHMLPRDLSSTTLRWCSLSTMSQRACWFSAFQSCRNIFRYLGAPTGAKKEWRNRGSFKNTVLRDTKRQMTFCK